MKIAHRNCYHRPIATGKIFIFRIIRDFFYETNVIVIKEKYFIIENLYV